MEFVRVYTDEDIIGIGTKRCEGFKQTATWSSARSRPPRSGASTRCSCMGATYNGIAQALTRDGVPTPGGKAKWIITTVKSILSNEKYKGDALLQKSYVEDFLTKRQVPNNGEIPPLARCMSRKRPSPGHRRNCQHER